MPYNLTARVIHWISALIVFGLFGVGLWMVDLTYYSPWYKTAPDWHRSIGILLAFVTVFRLIWKTIKSHPAIEGAQWEIFAAHIVHKFLYLLMFTLFVSGYLISTEDGRPVSVFNWFTIPSLGKLFENQADIAGIIHYYTAFTLIVFAILHAAAALKHHFINKDNTLRKMIGDSTR
ncbi:cytochrome b [Parasalinivibrio latis]|uniref:cytochrome b n=1 Tax=Parasalinivibrio latis TaxID=2952610 RepID=UPI0030E50EC2